MIPDKDKPYFNHYCPYCLHRVDPVSGDHWVGGCEYERVYKDSVNPEKPLTELQMLDKTLASHNKSINHHQQAKEHIIARQFDINCANAKKN